MTRVGEAFSGLCLRRSRFSRNKTVTISMSLYVLPTDPRGEERWEGEELTDER